MDESRRGWGLGIANGRVYKHARTRRQAPEATPRHQLYARVYASPNSCAPNRGRGAVAQGQRRGASLEATAKHPYATYLSGRARTASLIKTIALWNRRAGSGACSLSYTHSADFLVQLAGAAA